MKTFTVRTLDKQNIQFETEATTIGELLVDLDANGINYNGMTLYEGLTRSSFSPLTPEAILPHDVDYTNKRTGEHVVTSNLVFMLTTTDKKTSSGASRSELYTFIKANSLSEAITALFGRNFTQVKTVDLEKFVEDNKKSEAKKDIKEEVKEQSQSKNDECQVCPAASLILTFIKQSIENNIIDVDDILTMLDNMGVIEAVESHDKKFTDDEIIEIFEN